MRNQSTKAVLSIIIMWIFEVLIHSDSAAFLDLKPYIDKEKQNNFEQLDKHSKFSCSDVIGISQSECKTLVHFYQNTTGQDWYKNEGWLQTNQPCRWYGIRCMERSVISISTSQTLSGNNLIGEIPNLSNLTQLRTLILSNNQLSGTIPDISTLTQLSMLILSNNQLSGVIPVLSNLAQLRTLVLSNNRLSGTIPDISALIRLKMVSLKQNQFSGIIPNISNLTRLKVLSLEENQFNGEISHLVDLKQLIYLNLSNNQLSGVIPDLTTLSQLQTLSLFGNNLCRNLNIDYGKWNNNLIKYPVCK